jgi:predicted CoA-binding protein
MITDSNGSLIHAHGILVQLIHKVSLFTDRNMNDQALIDAFLAGKSFAVVGASQDRSKYGNKVLRAYQQNGRMVYPVNPNIDEVEGLKCYLDLESLPELVHGISIITPPKVTKSIVEQAGQLGIDYLWMQPGAESEAAIQQAEQLGIHLIANGPCALVVMGYRES